MWTTLLLLFTGASALTTGAVISACVLAGRIDSDQAYVAPSRSRHSSAALFDADHAHTNGLLLPMPDSAPASLNASSASTPSPQWRFN